MQKTNIVVLHGQNTFLLFPGKLKQPLTVGSGKKRKTQDLKHIFRRKTRGIRKGIGPSTGTESVTYTFCTVSSCCSVSRASVSVADHRFIACCVGQLLKLAEVVVVLTTVY